jgi:hypothetical protein
MKLPVVGLVLALLVVVVLVGCMPTLIPANETSVQKIIELPGITKDVIYDKSRLWFAKTFRSSKAVIDYENKEAGVIIGKGIVYYAVKNEGSLLFPNMMVDIPVRFTMKEDIRDGRVRVTFDNLNEGELENPVRYQSSMDRIRPRLLSLADDLGNFLSNPDADDKW